MKENLDKWTNAVENLFKVNSWLFASLLEYNKKPEPQLSEKNEENQETSKDKKHISLAWFTNQDLINFWIRDWYIYQGESVHMLAEILGTYNKNLWDDIREIIKYNTRCKRGKSKRYNGISREDLNHPEFNKHLAPLVKRISNSIDVPHPSRITNNSLAFLFLSDPQSSEKYQSPEERIREEKLQKFIENVNEA